MEQVVETRSPWGEFTPSAAVIEAIADYHGIDPLDLERPLYEVIDTDALDAVVAGAGTAAGTADVSVRFVYDGCLVRVSNDGAVAVAPHVAE